MNSTKKKVVLAFSSLSLVIIVAIVAVVAVFAARNVTVNSGFTINYTAIHVKATITGTYKVNSDVSATNLTTSGGNTITFSGSEKTDGTENVKSFNSVTLSLKASASENVKYVDFVYVITNTDSTDLIDIALNADPNTANDNLSYTYSVSLVSNSDATSTGSAYNNLVVGLKPGKAATISIRVQVEDLDTNATQTGTFAFVLTGVEA